MCVCDGVWSGAVVANAPVNGDANCLASHGDTTVDVPTASGMPKERGNATPETVPSLALPAPRRHRTNDVVSGWIQSAPFATNGTFSMLCMLSACIL